MYKNYNNHFDTLLLYDYFYSAYSNTYVMLKVGMLGVQFMKSVKQL